MHGPLNVIDWVLVVRECLGDLGIDWVTVLEWIFTNKVVDKDWIWMAQVGAVVFSCGNGYEP
jgi:hypothetical protein